MTQKVAFVDIDGTLVIDGEINWVLVEMLKRYDQVYLCTQRGPATTVIQLARSALGGLSSENVYCTDKIINALRNQLGDKYKGIAFGFSFKENDSDCFNEKEYPELERRLYQHVKTRPEDVDNPISLKELLNQLPWGKLPKLQGNSNDDEKSVSFCQLSDEFSDPNKVATVKYLLKKMLGSLSQENRVEVTLFDDSEENCKDVSDAYTVDIVNTESPGGGEETKDHAEEKSADVGVDRVISFKVVHVVSLTSMRDYRSGQELFKPIIHELQPIIHELLKSVSNYNDDSKDKKSVRHEAGDLLVGVIGQMNSVHDLLRLHNIYNNDKFYELFRKHRTFSCCCDFMRHPTTTATKIKDEFKFCI